MFNKVVKLLYGYEITGLENIPETGAVLIVFYHAAIPMDQLFFIARLYFEKRAIWTVVDKFFKETPNARYLMDFFQLIPGDFESCEKKLREGEIILIAPGGVYEALFSDDNYELKWKRAFGFAKLAMKANVKVVPVFTKNVREAWVSMKSFKSLWKMLFKKTGLPTIPLYGGLPVKLTTIVGNPISVDDCKSADEIKRKVKECMDELISENQKKPGSMWRALLERFY